MILALSLRPIPFHQDNYSFQFDADNNSRCSSQFYFKLSLRVTKRFRGCEASSEDVNKKITITKWTKTYEAMITTATCLRDNCNGKEIDL